MFICDRRMAWRHARIDRMQAPVPPARIAEPASRILRRVVACALNVGCLCCAAAHAGEVVSDVTEAQTSSFLFVPYPITEPAIGTGLLAGPVWMRPGPKDASGPSKPQAFGLGALWTDGGSRGWAAFDRRAWGQGRWWSTAIAVDADIRLSYHGLSPQEDRQLDFVLRLSGISVEAERRIGDGPSSLGIRTFAGRVDADFGSSLPTELDPTVSHSRVNGIALSWARDTRDELYTPSRGQHLSLGSTFYAQALGASFGAQSYSLRWTRYGKGVGKGVWGLRAVAEASTGDLPFYLRPYVSLRGVSAMRYAGERAASVETEYRWPLGERWDVLAFGGIGTAVSDRRGAKGTKTVSAGGLGVRFKARKYFGLTFGVDLAQGPDGLVGYVQIGNAWGR